MEGEALMSKMIFLLVVQICLFMPVSARAGDNDDRVIVTIYDAQRLPMVGVDIHLVLYRFGGEQIEVITSGNCTTDRDGRCQIVIRKAPRDASGFVRGQLQVEGYGVRSLLSRGGTYAISLWLDESGALEIPGESAPYEGVEPHAGPTLVWKPQLRVSDVLIPLLLIGGLLITILLRRRK